jgi:hypothetical protein
MDAGLAMFPGQGKAGCTRADIIMPLHRFRDTNHMEGFAEGRIVARYQLPLLSLLLINQGGQAVTLAHIYPSLNRKPQ